MATGLFILCVNFHPLFLFAFFIYVRSSVYLSLALYIQFILVKSKTYDMCVCDNRSIKICEKESCLLNQYLLNSSFYEVCVLLSHPSLSIDPCWACNLERSKPPPPFYPVPASMCRAKYSYETNAPVPPTQWKQNHTLNRAKAEFWEAAI